MAQECKLVILGGLGVGKSTITIQLINHHFIDEYDPTIEDCYRKQCTIDNETYLLDFLDTAGDGEYTELRDNYLKTGQGFLFIYSITSRSSFDKVSELLNTAILIRGNNTIPMVLVGNKCDLDNSRQVSKEEGEELAKILNCPFFESSAKDRINIEESFYKLVREAIKNTNSRMNQSRRK